MDSMEELLSVRVTPRSKRPRIVEEGSVLRVYVAEPPEAGKANAAVRRALASHFGVPLSSVDLVRGETSRDKLFRVDFSVR